MPSVFGVFPSITRPPPSPDIDVDDYDDGDPLEAGTPIRPSLSLARTRSTFTASSSTNALGSHLPIEPEYLLPNGGISGRSSFFSSPSNTPVPSRTNSPLPAFYHSGISSASPSDTDSEPASPLLSSTRRSTWRREEPRRWWTLNSSGYRRRRRDSGCSFSFRSLKRACRRVIRHPFFPKQPITILLTLLLLTLLSISITLLIIHILNPDKEPLPWRAYCTFPSSSSHPPSLTAPATSLDIASLAESPSWSSFPPENLDALPPAGIFVGVFSMDSAFERRMLVRTTWANHPRSRHGAGPGDGGDGTSRTTVRFILGQPQKTWERRIRLEMEKYNDIIILPVPENMNEGKTHAFFTWASTEAWVPPVYFETEVPPPQFSYSNRTSVPPTLLAEHDPLHTRLDRTSTHPMFWVRPDFVVKADDDSFIMLAELEARLRVDLHQDPPPRVHTNSEGYGSAYFDFEKQRQQKGSGSEKRADSSSSSSALSSQPATASGYNGVVDASASALTNNDPLIYWGYLVKNRFMAGEMYALSWSLVNWVARDPVVKGMKRGAEDKQTAKWMQLHPRADEVRWKNERCWIYDHPRAGTVYSHGFLFPSEVARVRRGVMSWFNRDRSSSAVAAVPRDEQQPAPTTTSASGSAASSSSANSIPIPSAWSKSSVSFFGSRYSPPLADLTWKQSVEALVEGSDMSRLFEGSVQTAEDAWRQREGRKARYAGKRVGGTVVVHFIKKNMWFLETALALLEGEEETELDRQRKQYQNANANMVTSGQGREIVAVASRTTEDGADEGGDDSGDGDVARQQQGRIQGKHRRR